jgi:hypothetical protein
MVVEEIISVPDDGVGDSDAFFLFISRNVFFLFTVFILFDIIVIVSVAGRGCDRLIVWAIVIACGGGIGLSSCVAFSFCCCRSCVVVVGCFFFATNRMKNTSKTKRTGLG